MLQHVERRTGAEQLLRLFAQPHQRQRHARYGSPAVPPTHPTAGAVFPISFFLIRVATARKKCIMIVLDSLLSPSPSVLEDPASSKARHPVPRSALRLCSHAGNRDSFTCATSWSTPTSSRCLLRYLQNISTMSFAVIPYRCSAIRSPKGS